MQELRDRIALAINQQELVELTERLIQIPSYYGVGKQETAVAEFICSFLTTHGIESWIELVQDGRHNVYGVLRGTGGGKTLMLNGHIDTVPPYDMADALVPHLIEGRFLFGRGASDMKGPVAAMVMALVVLKRLGISLPGDVLFAGVIDEERQSLGTIHLIENGPTADAAIVGEPTGGKLCIAHRGLEWYEFLFTGKTVHGGYQDEGINAILKATKFICAVENELVPMLNERTHPLLKRPTVNIGVIKGGTQLSTVAGECTLLLDRRFLPQEQYGDIEKELRDILARLSAEDPEFIACMRVTADSAMKAGYVHLPLEMEPEHPLVKLASRAANLAGGVPIKLDYFPAWTDAGLLSNYGKIPAVVYGPGYIECCHSKDEFIEVNQLTEGCLVYALCAVAFCG